MEVSHIDGLEAEAFELPTNIITIPQTPVQSYIQETLAAILDELSSPNGQPSITLKHRGKNFASLFINPQTQALETSEMQTYTTYKWPGRDENEAWRFTVALRVLAAIAEAVQAGLMVSKRDIYYSDPVCFGIQRTVDTLVDDLAHTMGVDRAALYVEAAAKGLVVGYYQIITRSDAVVDARLSNQDSLVPRTQDIHKIDLADVVWVLVLEKEAIYRRLASSNYHLTSAAGKGILVTGKGYPDLNTRAFVRKLFDHSRQLTKQPQFYALVDGDPDGMAIMATYKYGSVAFAHENRNLNVPGLHWLGLKIVDVVVGAGLLGDNTLIRLTKRDRKKVIAMLSRNPIWAADGPEPEWRVELQRMLMLNVKAETETLYDTEGGLTGWLNRKLVHLVQSSR
ncbi:putative meiosis-specific topoisomerase Spo11 [Aspergillus vadensis CBS 113365]|uniref:DNA topoisomerase (ATP-hydrolyzing) n=1 Tax=Aspergillus vadensis (strain CBS 113365 / IMI 142717 / IBT 24658) TaxID=1448311 RepID=A0A319B9U1_ASPVC|nr:meiotic recombination protein spo11 [Aspergillus vadensis CBS 113365]PYH69335.1 meiotic recombination protein spo11 [Aspergillus vadensis CBS 113365]